jgi:hypothetical protein
MNAKKLIIVLGGSVDFYHNNLCLFRNVEKITGWKFERVSPDRFASEIDGVNIDIRFCWNPKRDIHYGWFKKFVQRDLKMILSIPAEELIKKIKKTDGLLFLGHCGAFKGKKESIYLPNKFLSLDFKFPKVRRENLDIVPESPVKIDNVLIDKMSGKKGTTITTNLALVPINMDNQNKDLLIDLTKNLMKYGDVVDKESYEIARGISKEVKFGCLMISSDVLTIKKHMMKEEGFKPDKDNFAKAFIDSVKVMVGELK